ncbi:MAG: hypothetical protein AB7J13_04080 [Pyrinomonadaceae bacterium]
MTKQRAASPAADVLFCSSLADDRWHNLSGPNAFESWHFDAVSDDGRDALAITFYDNYVLSPRFHTNADTEANVTYSGKHRFPAVSLIYWVDGTPILSSVNEFVEGDFSTLSGEGCCVGGSSFSRGRAEYGSGFTVNIDLRTFGGRQIRAELEWLSIESDLMPRPDTESDAVWNAAVPRADVSGKLMLIGRRGKTRKLIQFRGTGYHDQVSSSNVHYRDLDSRMWGRAHFVDSTVVFERHGGVRDRSAPGKFYLIRNGLIEEREAACEASDYHRDKWGLLVPWKMEFAADDHIRLAIRPVRAFRSGFSEVKMLSRIELDLGDGKARKTTGITEFVDPRKLKNRFVRWITDLRIGTETRSPRF